MRILSTVFLVACAACAQNSGNGKSSCPPVETATANAPEQKPAFAAQTRGCAVKSGGAFEVNVLATGLNRPWAVEPLPGGGFLVTEKAGQMRIISAGGQVGDPSKGSWRLTKVACRR